MIFYQLLNAQSYYNAGAIFVNIKVAGVAPGFSPRENK
jgi:hypothetical protein